METNKYYRKGQQEGRKCREAFPLLSENGYKEHGVVLARILYKSQAERLAFLRGWDEQWTNPPATLTMALLIPSDDWPVQALSPENGTDFKLDELYKLLDCDLIDRMTLADGRIMIIDDEGKFSKPRNERATRLAGFVSPKQLIAELLRLREAGIDVIWAREPITDLDEEADFIAGDVLICEDEQFQ